MWKLAPVRVRYRYDIMISYCVCMKGWEFIPRLRERTLHAGRRDCDAILDLNVEDYACTTCSRLTGKWTVVPRLYDTGMRTDLITIQYDTIRCDAMQCNVMWWNTIQYNTIRYNTIRPFISLPPKDFSRLIYKRHKLMLIYNNSNKMKI